MLLNGVQCEELINEIVMKAMDLMNIDYSNVEIQEKLMSSTSLDHDLYNLIEVFENYLTAIHNVAKS